MRFSRFFAALAVGIWMAASAGVASSQTIAEVRVEGNERIEADTVRSYLPVGPGDPFDAREINRSLKELFATGLFADVAIGRAGDALVVRVVENPIVNRVAFEGNQAIEDEDLATEVLLEPRVVYTRPKVQGDVQRLIEIYRRSGRFGARVEPKVVILEQNRVDVIFEIDEGEVTTVRQIDFIGNKRFSDSALRDEIRTRESAWYRFFSTDDTYDPDRIDFDQELLRRFYLSNGYADFRVVSAVAELTRDREDFYVTFTVEEGERYRLGEIEIESTLKDFDPAPLLEQIELETGEWYDADIVEETILTLTDSVSNRGYAFVDVRPRIKRNREAQIVDVTFQIDEGSKIYLERIDIVGNVRTRDEVIRRELLMVEGDAFNTARINRSRQRVRNLGFFDAVDIVTDESDAPDRSDLRIEVEETATGELSFGAGVSSTDGLLGDASIRERNLLGRGQDLQLSFTFSSRRQEIDLSFTEPYFMDRDLAAGFDIFRKTVDLQDESSYDQKALGTSIRAGYPLTENMRQTVFYSIREDEISDIPADASRFIRAQEGEAVTSSLGQSVSYDVRDSVIDPSDGYLVQFRQELAGLGGDVKFAKHSVTYSHYYPLWDSWVLHHSLRQGHIAGLGQDVRLTDRYFLGGHRFRGFETSGLGPRDTLTGDALGGNVFYVGTGELRFPIELSRDFNLRGAFFTDIGSLTDVEESGPGVRDEGSLRASGGFGIAYRSPIGPLRFDFAHVFKKEDHDQTENFRFSVGTRY